ncbi:hypothetical protein [Rhodococcus qingshengii]|uniref:hypothetical protein n=1 Tax=Rhodococcus qingshengii TaxID=334542 RepID=UPI001ABF8DC2|nr:hypothetical protein [Rhodococcus qingshengii]MBX9151872.1 hypothetical protein [Rhodococcus qingshengii]
MQHRNPDHTTELTAALSLTPCGHDEAAGAYKGVQRLHKLGARLATLGKWPLGAGHVHKNAGRAVAVG